MTHMMPLLLMSGSDDSKSKTLMMAMMQNPNMDISQMLPLLMNDDSVDMKTLFMTTTMIQVSFFEILPIYRKLSIHRISLFPKIYFISSLIATLQTTK